AADASHIAAASTPGAPGDGSRALAIARLRDDATVLDAATVRRPGTVLAGLPGVILTGVDVSTTPPDAHFTLTRTAAGELTVTDGGSSQTITLADLLGPATTEAPQPVHFVEDARQLHALLPERCLAPRTGPGAADSGLDRAERVALPISAIPSTELGDRREYGGPGDP
ncbi:MAG: hypothetical protein C4289_07290, partial [Chloroflexota bacterium]